MRNIKKDGIFFWCYANVSLFDHPEYGRVIVSLHTDITERKKNEELLRENEKNLQKHAENLEEALLDKENLLKELHHRVKNNLQIISALTIMQKQNLDEKSRMIFNDFQNRINAMANIHEILYRSEDINRLKISEYISSLINNLILSFNVNQELIKIKLDVEEIDLDLRDAMYYGLIINELVSNALKYAYPNNQKGSIEIFFKKSVDQKIVLKIKDNGIGLPYNVDPSKLESMGLKIVYLLTKQLKKEIKFNKKEGTEWIISSGE